MACIRNFPSLHLTEGGASACGAGCSALSITSAYQQTLTAELHSSLCNILTILPLAARSVRCMTTAAQTDIPHLHLRKSSDWYRVSTLGTSCCAPESNEAHTQLGVRSKDGKSNSPPVVSKTARILISYVIGGYKTCRPEEGCAHDHQDCLESGRRGKTAGEEGCL